ncbi:hypothetical protein V1514DRAFT_275646 [Lipomyces japonicus]|uniref:uncharacterized protein n=1 Tax=Lipomyces japonicus TaxID=56871 RepID=UPI0034CF97C0
MGFGFSLISGITTTSRSVGIFASRQVCCPGRTFATSCSVTMAAENNARIKSAVRTTTKQSLRRIIPQRPPKQNAINFHPSSFRNKFEINKLSPCVALTVADSYDLPKVLENLHHLGHLNSSMLLPQEVAHATYPLSSGAKADAFILSNGSIVTFGMTEIETIELADLLVAAEIRPYAIRESEDMDFINLPYDPPDFSLPAIDLALSSDSLQNSLPHHNPRRSYMDGETICISGPDKILDMAAFASGLARSTKLAVLENGLEDYIENIRDITDRLATGRKLPVNSGRQVLKKTGELLALRGNLNLYSELIETPDLYWSEPELEQIYRQVSKNLDIAPRIAILNKKLDYVSEVVSILKSHLSEQQSVRLEWMVILLIAVEVVMEISHLVERYYEKQKAKESVN